MENRSAGWNENLRNPDGTLNLERIAKLSPEDLRSWLRAHFAGADPFGSRRDAEHPATLFAMLWHECPGTTFRENFSIALKDEIVAWNDKEDTPDYLVFLLGLVTEFQIGEADRTIIQLANSKRFIPVKDASGNPVHLHLLEALAVRGQPRDRGFWNKWFEDPRFTAISFRALSEMDARYASRYAVEKLPRLVEILADTADWKLKYHLELFLEKNPQAIRDIRRKMPEWPERVREKLGVVIPGIPSEVLGKKEFVLLPKITEEISKLPMYYNLRISKKDPETPLERANYDLNQQKNHPVSAWGNPA